MRSLLKTLPPDTQRVGTLINLAHYLEGSEFQQRLDYLREAMHLADSLQDIPKLAAAKSTYASIQNFLGAYQVALEEVIASMALYQQIHDSAGVAKCRSTLGLVRRHRYQTAVPQQLDQAPWYGFPPQFRQERRPPMQAPWASRGAENLTHVFRNFWTG